MLSEMPDPGTNMVARRQLQTQLCTLQNINSLSMDQAFRSVQGAWIHLTGLTGNEGGKWDFCTVKCPWPE